MAETSKKREWIKNIAIIFLAILLALTFFSNTIMNHSLPEVSTYMVGSGTIVTRVQGTGMVEAVDPYNVMVKETRKVASVAVKVDQKVEAGDVLYYLSEIESDELKTAQKELDSLKLAYEKSILQGGFTRVEVAEVEMGTFGTVEQFQAILEQYNNAVDMAQAKVDLQTVKVEELQRQLGILAETKVDAKAEQKAFEAAQKKLTDEQANLKIMEGKLLMLDSSDPEYATLSDKINTSKYITIPKLEVEKVRAEDALTKKNNDTGITDQITAISKQKVDEEVLLASYKNEYERLKSDKEKELSEILAKLDLAESYKAMAEKKEEVEKLKSNALGGTITAPVSGRITSLNYVAGESTTPEIPAAVIQLDGKGYTVSFPVSNEQARKVKVGDPVSIVNGWYYRDVTANLVSIQTDKDNPRKNKLLKFDIIGESVVPGDNMTLSIGQKSSNYDLIVPNSAIREDNNGKFVLQLSSRSTPFGSRYIAKRVNIEVLAADDNNSAITADSFSDYGEYVITTSSEPIQSGQQVRLAPSVN